MVANCRGWWWLGVVESFFDQAQPHQVNAFAARLIIMSATALQALPCSECAARAGLRMRGQCLEDSRRRLGWRWAFPLLGWFWTIVFGQAQPQQVNSLVVRVSRRMRFRLFRATCSCTARKANAPFGSSAPSWRSRCRWPFSRFWGWRWLAPPGHLQPLLVNALAE